MRISILGSSWWKLGIVEEIESGKNGAKGRDEKLSIEGSNT